jgi:outer membrane protein TolC
MKNKKSGGKRMFCCRSKFLRAVLAFSAIFLFAEENHEQDARKTVLTVDEAVEYAMENSRTLKTADIDLEIARRAGNNGWNVLLPDVKLTGTLNRQNDLTNSLLTMNKVMGMFHTVNPSFPSEVEETESMKWTGMAGLSVDWTFTLASIQQIRAAKKDYEIGKISYEKSVQETKASVQKLFYGLLLKQENLKIQQTSLQNARSRAVQSETNFKNGLVPEIAMLQAQVTYQNKIPDVEKDQRELKQQFDMFAFLLGLPVGTEIELSGSIETEFVDVDARTLIENYGENDLDIQNIERNLEKLKMNLSALNLGTYAPFFNVSFGLQPMLTDFLDADKGGFPFGGDWVDNGSLSLTVGWDLTNFLPWSKNRQNAKDLKANIEKLEVNMETLKEKQKMDVISAVNKLTEARQQIDVMGRNISLAQRSYDMTLRSYNNGRTELLDVRDAENQLNQAKLGLASQKFNYISALLDLEQILNTNLRTK